MYRNLCQIIIVEQLSMWRARHSEVDFWKCRGHDANMRFGREKEKMKWPRRATTNFDESSGNMISCTCEADNF